MQWLHTQSYFRIALFCTTKLVVQNNAKMKLWQDVIKKLQSSYLALELPHYPSLSSPRSAQATFLCCQEASTPLSPHKPLTAAEMIFSSRYKRRKPSLVESLRDDRKEKCSSCSEYSTTTTRTACNKLKITPITRQHAGLFFFLACRKGQIWGSCPAQRALK